MRRWPLVAACAVLCVLAGGGALYVASRPAGHSSPGAGGRQSASRPAALAELTAAAASSRTGVTAALRSPGRATGLGGALAAFVVDAGSGRVLYDRGATTPVPPASTVKLLTAAAAITSLGPDARLSTNVVQAGRTLYLVGGGDVTLSARHRRGYPPTATLATLARRTASSIASSGGALRLRYDTTAWQGPALAPGWSSGYFTGGDVSRLSPLEVDEGRLRHDAPDRVVDPAAQAAAQFAAALHAEGLTVRGAPRPAQAPTTATRIATVSSAPLPALVDRLLTVSDNDLAEALGRVVAVKAGEPSTFDGAARAVTDRLDALGIPMDGVRLFDASGLSHRDRVTPRALVAVLRLAARTGSPLAAVAHGLPVSGLTGTLADRYRHGRSRLAAGIVRAKTGTLAGVSALAGQVVDADGRLLLFAFVTDRAAAPGTAEAALDLLAARLARCGCP